VSGTAEQEERFKWRANERANALAEAGAFMLDLVDQYYGTDHEFDIPEEAEFRRHRAVIDAAIGVAPIRESGLRERLRDALLEIYRSRDVFDGLDRRAVEAADRDADDLARAALADSTPSPEIDVERLAEAYQRVWERAGRPSGWEPDLPRAIAAEHGIVATPPAADSIPSLDAAWAEAEAACKARGYRLTNMADHGDWYGGWYVVANDAKQSSSLTAIGANGKTFAAALHALAARLSSSPSEPRNG